VLVQDPADASYPSMPQSVLNQMEVDGVASAAELGKLVGKLVGTPATEPPPASAELAIDLDLAGVDQRALDADRRPGRPAGFGCPTCHGSMLQIEEDGMLRYRCRVGHAWSGYGLLVEQNQALETALWMALRVLEERAELSRELAERAAERGSVLSCQRFLRQADEATSSAGEVRRLLQTPNRAVDLDPIIGPSLEH
jgi:two-component system, chemotaxis family, protein-glutamate methylesterase/glutaminase